MSLKGCPACVKYLVFVFNLLFWLLGLLMVGIGIWAIADPNLSAKLGDENSALAEHLKTAGIAITIVGSIIMITGFFGCCGSIRESQCCLVLFFIVLLIIFLVLCGIGIFLIVGITNSDVSSQFRTKISELLLRQVKESPSEQKGVLAVFESFFKCCGDTGSSDYATNGKEFSAECKQAMADNLMDPTPGCTDEFYNRVKKEGVILGAVVIGVAFLVLIGMIFACTLCCAIRRNREYVDDY